MAEPCIAVEGVSKAFGSFVAVDNLSFEIPAGIICGFLGPNGAGKTTTVRMMLDIIRPERRRRSRCSAAPPPSSSAIASAICPEEKGLYKKMTARAR